MSKSSTTQLWRAAIGREKKRKVFYILQLSAKQLQKMKPSPKNWEKKLISFFYEWEHGEKEKRERAKKKKKEKENLLRFF